MTHHSAFLAQKRFGSLDGLRAISILAVIWHHTQPQWAHASEFAALGTQGVTLFFAISGFLITTLLLRERSRSGAINLKAFYLRRTLRIFPLYYGVLLIYIVVVAVMERHSAVGQGFFNNLIYFATYTSNIFVPLDGRVIFYFAWSLAAEEQFYLIWPLALYLTRKSSTAGALLSTVFIACVGGQLLGNKFLSAVPLAIVAGSLLAMLLHARRGFDVLYSVLGNYWSAPALMTIAGLALTLVPAPVFVIQTLFAAVVGACVIREKHPLTWLFSRRPIVYIGSISYGLYMLHMLCKNLVVKLLAKSELPTTGVEVFILTCVLTTVVAGLSFKYYESYFLKLNRKHEAAPDAQRFGARIAVERGKT